MQGVSEFVKQGGGFVVGEQGRAGVVGGGAAIEHQNGYGQMQCAVAVAAAVNQSVHPRAAAFAFAGV